MNPFLRRESPSDAAAIRAVTVAAFLDAPHTDHTEQFIVEALRREGALTISLVAELDGEVVGHVAASPVSISDGSADWYGLGPVSVRPELQGQGIGSLLVQGALRSLRERDAAGCVLLGDPAYSLEFYTTILGFEKKHDIPMGAYRWLTVCSPEGAAGVELVLEPLAFPPARTYQKALFEAGIPATAFLTKDIAAEYSRLERLGVRFRGEPASTGPITSAMFEDTCGNLIHLVQPAA